jgi:hypothetical protein
LSVLSSGLRKQLEDSCVRARRAAEAACRAALGSLGVGEERPPSHLSEEERLLRRGLRAKSRQLGDAPGSIALLVTECAYEQWHRLLFARFLAENGLLIHPDFRAPVTLAECEELAEDLGEPDGWAVAGGFAAQILPGIFRLDDPCVQLRLAPEGRLQLEQVVAGLPAELFIADDALGWVYQFWQKEKKDEVNASERKVGGADLGPVTQLFTENYMVRFLLENSLGAWWAARHPDSPLIKEWAFLRFGDNGATAAGSFDGWPERVGEVTVMDPCCGSGHFLVEAFGMLWRMRAEEEGLSPVAAQDAVLRDNLFGLELDPRCVQIAMFAVALSAWKGGGGWRELPTPNITCSGIPVKAPVDEWVALANDDERLENALARLHILFRDADTLGSLLDPKRAIETSDPTSLQKSFEDVDWDEIAPLLAKAFARENDDPAAAVLGADAAGIACAADYLSRRFTLIATNPPFLGRGSQAKQLRDFCLARFPLAEPELACVMSRRWQASDTAAVVLPQNWLFMGTFSGLREEVLSKSTWRMLAWLGPGAFESVSGHVVQVVLLISDHRKPVPLSQYAEISAGAPVPTQGKPGVLRSGPIVVVNQMSQLGNPDSLVVAGGALKGPFLSDIAESRAGLGTGDDPSFVRFFWEVPSLGAAWETLQSSPSGESAFSGCEKIILWEGEAGRLAKYAESVSHLNTATQGWRRGKPFWGSAGVVVKLMGDLNVSLYCGGKYDRSCAVVRPRAPEDLGLLWSFAESGELERAVRSFHAKLSVETSTLLAAPIDIQLWRSAAEASGPLPEPWSGEPTQWLFGGRPEVATEPLQVAVGRLVGFRWPEQPESDDLDELADDDGVVCLPSVLGERVASDRLQELLSRAFGGTWSPARTDEMLAASGSKNRGLESWLREDFFKAHCQMFKNRPFVWQIWDGRKDGFSALVNYHRLDRPMLERLTYTYLGDWIERQTAGVRDDVAGAEERLAAARDLQRRLELILEGEPPYDIYVRWKSLAEQPLGWDPDLNDGVRLNVRPFVEAGVLRSKFNVKWDKDRGKNPDGSERHNDLHYTLAQKQEARRGSKP